MTASDVAPVSRRARRRLALLYVAAWAVVLAALGGELLFAARRVLAKRAAERHRAANVFEKARDVLEGGGESLWLHPGVRYRPGARLSLGAGGESFEIVINSLGFRTHEFDPRKPPGRWRVLCIGGSTTVQGRTNDETYPAFLERQLRARFPDQDLEVLNLGINGTTSDYWLSREDELFGYDPDVIVQYDFVNDLFFRHLPRYATEHPWRTRFRRSLMAASLAPPDAVALEPYMRRTVRNLRQMATDAGDRGVLHVIGAFAGPAAARATPSFGSYLDLNVESWGGRFGLRFYRDYEALLRSYDRDLRRVAAEGRLRVAAVDERVADPALFIDLCHMTGPGIEALAEAFLPAVAEALEGVPPPAGRAHK